MLPQRHFPSFVGHMRGQAASNDREKQPRAEETFEIDRSSSELEAEVPLLHKPHQRAVVSRWPFCLKLGAAALILALGIIAVLAIKLNDAYTSSNPIEKGNELGNCGSNAKEARANGCRFDVMSFAWQRPACYYEELVEKFKTRIDWHFYSNSTLEPSYQLPIDRVIAGDYDTVYAPKKYHPLHCVAMWEKMHIAHLEGRPTDNELFPLHHTEHCGKVLLIDYTGESSCHGNEKCPTRLRTLYAKCGYH